MTLQLESVHDDRVLPATRAVAFVIVPFLLVAFAVLYPVPGDTKHLFAWQIRPTMTAMMLGSAYLGGAYFFVRAGQARRWHTVKGGFLPVALFATLMGIATIAHWDKFNHRHVAFWLWVLLYFTTPFLIAAVYAANQRHDAARDPDEKQLPGPATRLIALTGAAALATGAFLFVAPQTAIRIWPWLLTPLTARVLGAIFCLGAAGVGVLRDRRWSTARIPVQVAGIMLTLIVVAGIRAHGELRTDKVLTWLLPAGFLIALAGLARLYLTMERRDG